jgi:predicted Zn finger-like uncharacterized protein
MPINMLCPVCGAPYELDDSQVGKTVRCRKCEETFTVKAQRDRKKYDYEDNDRRAERAPRVSRVRDEEDDRPRRRRARDEDEDERPRRRRSREDDDEDDRRRRRARKSSGAGTVLIVLGSIAAVLLVVCGGGAAFLYFRFRAAVEDIQGQMQAGPQPGGGGPAGPAGPKGGMGGGAGPMVPQPPPAQAVQDVEGALAALKDNERWRQDDGLRWLASARPDPARRAEVVAALEPLVRRRKGSGNDTDINALAVWGGQDSLPLLIETLHSAGAKGPVPGGDHVRLKATLRALGTLKDPKAAPALVQEWQVYPGGHDTAWALQQIGPAAQKDVLPAFDHPNDMVREAARAVIRSYGTSNDAITEQVLADVADRDWGRRGAAASWLAEVTPNDALRPRVVKALDGMLSDVLALNDTTLSRDVGQGKILRWPAEQAVNGLVKWCGKDDLPALEHVVKTLPRFGFTAPRPAGDQIFDALARTGDEKAVALIIEAGHRRNVPLAAEAIKRMGPRGEAGLRKAMDDPNPEVQRALPQLFALVGLKDDLRLAKALRELKSDDKQRRKYALGQLSEIPVDEARRKEVTGLLVPLIDSNDEVTASVARSALLHWTAKDDVPGLLRLLKPDDRYYPRRQAVIAALGATKDEKAIEALVPLLGDFNVTADVEKALIAAGSVAEKPVRKMLDSPDVKVRLAAARVLKGLGNDYVDFGPAWADAHSDDPQRRNAGLLALAGNVTVPDNKKAEVLELAEKLKDNSDLVTRQQAIAVLAKYATKDQVPTLLKLMEGKGDGQRTPVIAALGRLKEEKAIPLLVKSLEVATERAAAERALIDIGPACEKPLLEELKGDKLLTRVFCLRVLAKVGTRDSLPALEELTRDSSPRHKVLVIEATKAIDAIKKREKS